MDNNNRKKAMLLGMPFGTAANRLRKLIMFSLMEETAKNLCFRCGARIEHPDDLSIEHKKPWQSASDPAASFFDLGNSAFSHLRCNVAGSSRNTASLAPHGSPTRYNYHECRCEECRDANAEKRREWRTRTGRH